ncbi:MAG: TIGR04282 family arsenosugar biosynthesis glycosyltransferase [Burkholderiales bacterium]|nr:TIGR04282 family arsenosugar biosynthesis glycosyltransferase [Burkholderiales bacterium]
MTPGIAVFARAPEPGRAKTRLVPRLGEGGAAVLAARLTTRMLEVATDAAVGPVTLHAAPDASHPFFSLCARRFGVALQAQCAGDLGARMHAALVATVAAHGAALLVGSDIADATGADLQAAARQLRDGADVVLGPVADGGWWLIGVRAPPPPTLFDAIAWSTASVFDATCANVASAGLRLATLPLRHDVDVPADLDRLAADAASAALLADLPGAAMP